MSLFIGFQIDALLEVSFKKTSSHLFSLFTSGGDYLVKIDESESSYVGKSLPDYSSMEDVEAIAMNVKSLASRLAPDYPFEETRLILLKISV
jgi:hypothetical protein